MNAELIRILEMEFPKRLAAQRKERKLTQQALADAICAHVTQIRRYEWGGCQPTLEVLRKLPVALGVNADTLILDGERGSRASPLRLKLEAVESLCEDDQRVIVSLIDAYIKKRRLEELAAS